MYRSILGLAGLALAALASAARAEADKSTMVFNLGVATDYVSRGVSQTDGKAERFGGADLTGGRFYAGTWISNVDFGDSADLEYDLYAGFKSSLGRAAFDLGLTRNGYVNAPSGAGYDNWEVRLAASVLAGKATLGAEVDYSPDDFGPVGRSTYYELNLSLPVARRLTVSGALGRQTMDGPGDYTTWDLGVGWAITPKLNLDLRYWDTDRHGFGSTFASRVAVALEASF